MKLVLASKSPRRKEILTRMGYKFQIIPAVGDEYLNPDLDARAAVTAIAAHKAAEVFCKAPDCVVLAADTVVVENGEILGKPKDDADERRMLDRLSGKTHEVFTGYTVICKDKKAVGAERSEVLFENLSELQKDKYVASGLGLDKAGGYGIQDGYGLVKSICGSYSNVMGLPEEKIADILAQFDIDR